MIKIEKNLSGIATIVINRPEMRNALDEAVIAGLTAAFIELGQDQDVRVILLYGKGRIFCAGADIGWMRRMADNGYEDNIADAKKLAVLFEAISSCPKPTIAVVKGGAYGGGVGLVAACDIAIADEKAVFVLSEVRLGVIPAVISPYLVNAMGARQVKRYTLTAEPMTAEDALRLGLIHRVVSFDEVDAEAEVMASLLLKGSPEAQSMVKELINVINNAEFSPALHDYTAMMIAKARASKDGIEGLQAFLSKRRPAWMIQDDN